MKVVRGDEAHWVKELPGVCGGGRSRRTIMPSRDGGDVGATVFACAAGDWCEGIEYDWDETVFVHAGRVEIEFVVDDDYRVVELGPGDHYTVPASEVYNLRVLEDCVVFCVFSPVPHGPAVNLEPEPTSAE